MRISNFLFLTQKETPADAELISHQLMLRTGMIRKLGAGLYTWLPLGYRVLSKVTAIVRAEMDRSGALELLMPAVQPAELWQETERWDTFGDQLLKMRDRGQRDYCFGPTHEEVITDIMRHELKSYKQLPLNCYQIQTKFRDEIRPRFGVMRACEFMMKDAYSFHASLDSLQETYEIMYRAYCAIFDKIGLDYRVVMADTGSIGGEQSHEFQVLADSGEDVIYYSDGSDYAANVELAEAVAPAASDVALAEMQSVDTPQQTKVSAVSEFLKIAPQSIAKTLLVKGAETPLVALVLRGDHELNPTKAEKLVEVAAPLQLATDQEIVAATGCPPGYLGPVNLDMPIIVDRSAAALRNFVCGANQSDQHLKNVNWQRDATYQTIADLRNVVVGDPSPDGHGLLKMCRGIEVGHIFQLGDKYSQAMQATVLDQQGKAVHLQMGCYGLGVSRVVAAAIEQSHDAAGIIWPAAIAPFQVVLIPIKMHKSLRVHEAVETLYQDLLAANIDVLLDDRDERPGTMFADADLIGIPHRLVLSERGLDAGEIEYKARTSTQTHTLKLDNCLSALQTRL